MWHVNPRLFCRNRLQNSFFHQQVSGSRRLGLLLFTSAVRSTFGGSRKAALKGTLNTIKSTELCIDADTIHEAYGFYIKTHPSASFVIRAHGCLRDRKHGILLKGGGNCFPLCCERALECTSLSTEAFIFCPRRHRKHN